MRARCLCLRVWMFGLASLYGRVDQVVRTAFDFVVQRRVGLAELQCLTLEQLSVDERMTLSFV